jgi:hypothetical protein
MEFTINTEERELLLELLEERHREMLRELSRTKHLEFKQALRRKERLLESVIIRLRSLQQAGPPMGRVA